jgi:hypothetical protein
MLGWLDAMLGNGRKDSDLLPFTTSVTRFQAHTEARSSLLPGFLWDAEAKLREMRATNHSWLSFTPPELGFLNTFIKLAGISSAEMRLPVDDTDPAEERIRFGAPVFQFHGHGSFSIQVASYGQRRLLSFLHYGACNPSVLIADELTNGLHHEWIEACVDELKQRQSFVATQHPLLIDYLPVSCAKDAETAFIQCRLVEEHGKQWMHWRNTTPEEANQFWKSYETGVQFINEVLRTDGLW